MFVTKSKEFPRLSIFETFKTKTSELTGEALRQRSIIVVLATQSSPADRTRTAISQRIAQENGIIWKNIYSGIFRDLDEVLIPLGLVEEEGRLPLKRGPKALQEKGIPYYNLSMEGKLVSLSLSEIVGRNRILSEVISDEMIDGKSLKDVFEKLEKFVPSFTYSLIEKYVRAYCDGTLKNLLPFSLQSLKGVSDENLKIQKDFLEGFLSMPKVDREAVLSFLEKIT